MKFKDTTLSTAALLPLATSAGATDYGAMPAVFPAALGGFGIALSVIFWRWALGEQEGSPRAKGYWGLSAITGLAGAALTIPSGFLLIEDGARHNVGGFYAGLFIATLIIGLVFALAFAGALKMLGFLMRMISGKWRSWCQPSDS